VLRDGHVFLYWLVPYFCLDISVKVQIGKVERIININLFLF